tara:strand:- start:311 stop:613 length:303 start_codon:yes stop_codon:yes gene_type:complete
MIFTPTFFIWPIFIGIGCGEPPTKKVLKHPRSPEYISVANKEREDSATQLAIDVKQTRKDSDCIRSFVADQNMAPKEWDQPSFDDYEKNDCKEMYHGPNK